MASRASDMERARRYAAFLLAGGIGFMIYLALSNLFHYVFGLSEALAPFLGTVLAVPPTYLLQRTLTFRGRTAGRQALPMYVALQVGNAFLISLLSSLGARTSLPGYVVFVIAGVAGVLVSYWVQSRLIFRK